MEKELKFIVADDDTVYPIGLINYLKTTCPGCVITEVKNGREAVELLDRENYDFVLLDYLMPVMDGAEATKIIKQKKYDTKVIILSSVRDPIVLKAILDSHPDGYYLKDTSKAELKRAVENIMAGKHFYSDEVIEIMVEHNSHFNSGKDVLSDAEWEVLLLKLGGVDQKKISAMRHTSPETTKKHLHNIYDKLGNNPFTLTCYAVKHGRIKSLSFFTER
ncbi:MAG: response regulator transcription factor [Bacteroidia bacterium]|nr:response regulator transcription factor [Bacteroidia bacterium]